MRLFCHDHAAVSVLGQYRVILSASFRFFFSAARRPLCDSDSRFARRPGAEQARGPGATASEHSAELQCCDPHVRVWHRTAVQAERAVAGHSTPPELCFRRAGAADSSRLPAALHACPRCPFPAGAAVPVAYGHLSHSGPRGAAAVRWQRHDVAVPSGCSALLENLHLLYYSCSCAKHQFDSTGGNHVATSVRSFCKSEHGQCRCTCSVAAATEVCRTEKGRQSANLSFSVSRE